MITRWVDRDHDLAWTVALVSTAANTADDVIIHLGGRPTQPRNMTYAQALRWRDDNFNEHGVIQVHRLRRYTVVFEPNGWACADDHYLAKALTRLGGHYISAYWSPSNYQILEALNGVITARFDPVYVDKVAPPPGEVYPPWLDHDAYADTDRFNSTSLRLLHARTGIRIRRRWLHKRLPTYRIPPP